MSGKGDAPRPLSVPRAQYYDSYTRIFRPGQEGYRGLGVSPPPRFAPGESCGHPGCLSHVSHPCEGCGRIAGRNPHEVP